MPEGIQIQASVEPDAANPGSLVTLAVRIELPPGWQTFDVEQYPQVDVGTRILLRGSEAYSPLDRFVGPPARERPDARHGNRPLRYFDRSPTFRRLLLLADDLPPDRYVIEGQVEFIAEDPARERQVVVRDHLFRTEISIAPAAQPQTGDAPPGHPSTGRPTLDPAEPEVVPDPVSHPVDPPIAVPAAVPAAAAAVDHTLDLSPHRWGPLESIKIGVPSGSSALDSTFVPVAAIGGGSATSWTAGGGFALAAAALLVLIWLSPRGWRRTPLGSAGQHG